MIDAWDSDVPIRQWPIEISPASDDRTVHPHAAAQLHAEIEDIAGLLVDPVLRHAEPWIARAHHPAGFWILIENNAAMAERARSRATIGEAGPAPTSATHLPSVHSADPGRNARISLL
jgi:hypothetical protein